MGGRYETVRIAAVLVIVCAAVGALAVVATQIEPVGRPFERSSQVVIVAAPRGLRLADLDGVPAMVAAANVDSPGRTARSAWATVGTGAAVDDADTSRRGRLADAVHGAGRSTALVAPDRDPPSRLGVADGHGRVDTEVVADGVGGILDQTSTALRSGAALVLVDGERLDRSGLDTLLERLRAATVTALIVSTKQPEEAFGLAPFLANTTSGGEGGILSPSTKHVGLVVLADVAPTALDVLGIEIPTEMTGRPLRRASEATSVSDLVLADRRSRLRDSIWNPSMGVIVLGLAGVAVWGWRRPALAPAARTGLCLLLAGWPLATWLVRAVPGAAAASAWALLIAVAFDLAAVALTWVAFRGRPAAALAAILGATVLLVTVDLALGGSLQLSSALGSDAHSAGRFYGLGNGAFAAYAGAAAVIVASARRRAMWIPALLLFVTLVVAMPALGNDVGGALTLGPVFGLAVAALWDRLSWRVLLVLSGATALVLGAAIAFDLSRSADAQSHLARFVTGSGRAETLSRRIGVSLRQYTAQPGLVLVVLLALAMVVLLARGRFSGALPPGTPARIGVWAALGVGLVGNALNDSGAVVTAVVAVPLIPYLVIRAGASDRLPADDQPPPAGAS